MKRTPLKRRGRLRSRRERVPTLPLLQERSGGACELRISPVCTGRAVHPHHRLMRSHGGGHELENLIHVCFGCHVWVHAEPAVSYERGWLVRSFDDPGSVPVRLAA